jgi:hypothetical protein
MLSTLMVIRAHQHPIAASQPSPGAGSFLEEGAERFKGAMVLTRWRGWSAQVSWEQVGFPARMLLSNGTHGNSSHASESTGTTDHSVTPRVITSCPAGFTLQYQRVSCKVQQNDKHINVNVYDDPTCNAAPNTISRAPANYGAMGSCEASTDVYQSDITKYTIGYPPYVFGNCIDSAIMWQGHSIPGCVSDITVEVYISNVRGPPCPPRCLRERERERARERGREREREREREQGVRVRANRMPM